MVSSREKNGELDWLDAANATVPKDEDCGYLKIH